MCNNGTNCKLLCPAMGNNKMAVSVEMMCVCNNNSKRNSYSYKCICHAIMVRKK